MIALSVASWISVDDQLPDADETVLIALPDGDDPVWFGYFTTCWWLLDGGECHPTHWMPLPEPPQ